MKDTISPTYLCLPGLLLQLLQIFLIFGIRRIGFNPSQPLSYQLGIDKNIIRIDIAQQTAVLISFGDIPHKANIFAFYQLPVSLPCLHAKGFQFGAHLRSVNTDIPHPFAALYGDGITIYDFGDPRCVLW